MGDGCFVAESSFVLVEVEDGRYVVDSSFVLKLVYASLYNEIMSLSGVT